MDTIISPVRGSMFIYGHLISPPLMGQETVYGLLTFLANIKSLFHQSYAETSYIILYNDCSLAKIS